MNSYPGFRREQFQTMKQIADALGVPYYQIVRAVRARLIPHYRLSNSKKYLLLSDVLIAMKKHGGEVDDG